MLEDIQRSLNMAIITAILILGLGIIFLLKPDMSITILSNSLGVILIIYGVFEIINSFRTTYIMSSSHSTVGVLALVAGLAIFLNRDIFERILTFALGVIFITSGLSKVRLSILLNRRNEKWLVPFIISVVTIITGVLMVIKPISKDYVTLFISIMMIIFAISDFVDTIYLKIKMKKNSDLFDELLPVKNNC